VLYQLRWSNQFHDALLEDPLRDDAVVDDPAAVQ